MHYDYDMWSVLRAAVTKHHKLDWLKTTELYSLTVLETGSLKSSCWQGHDPSEPPEKGLSLPLPAFGINSTLHLGLHMTIILLCLFSFHQDTNHRN